MRHCKCGRWVATGVFCCLLAVGAVAQEYEKHTHEVAHVVSVQAPPGAAIMISGTPGARIHDDVGIRDAIFSSVTFVNRAT
jgi:hypothetical protein